MSLRCHLGVHPTHGLPIVYPLGYLSSSLDARNNLETPYKPSRNLPHLYYLDTTHKQSPNDQVVIGLVMLNASEASPEGEQSASK
ncbi:MAG: hypothetical protein H6600_06695 [Flavobacteriales bacterium]|nr:hypothetical protein [Flavobacteriales bacterium]